MCWTACQVRLLGPSGPANELCVYLRLPTGSIVQNAGAWFPMREVVRSKLPSCASTCNEIPAPGNDQR